MALVAYADPPYVGKAKKHYHGTEVNHRLLIAHLCSEYDSWALSCSSPSLYYLLTLCPPGVRIAAWVKPFAIMKKGVNPLYAWEPVIYVPRKRGLEEPMVRDWVSANITLKRGLCGTKPEAFCFWLFSLLGMRPDDTLIDLFPGSGAVSEAWKRWCTQWR